MKERLVFIDYLKVIGLYCVVLAHITPQPHPFILQLRNFDVPLLVLVSAYLASYSNNNVSIGKYVYKRFARLVIPAWIFIIIFLPVWIIFYKVPSFYDVLLTFTFQKDCGLLGYLWVVWVFFVCAILNPLFGRIGYKKWILLSWLGLLFLNEVVCYYIDLEDNRFLYCTWFTVLPYGYISYVGYHFDKIKNKQWMATLSFIMFVIIAYEMAKKEGAFVITSAYKYPARIYYLTKLSQALLAQVEVSG